MFTPSRLVDIAPCPECGQDAEALAEGMDFTVLPCGHLVDAFVSPKAPLAGFGFEVQLSLTTGM